MTIPVEDSKDSSESVKSPDSHGSLPRRQKESPSVSEVSLVEASRRLLTLTHYRPIKILRSMDVGA